MAAYVDLIMCLGIVILAMAFPTTVGAFSRGEPPRTALLSLIVGGAMIFYASSTRPGGYTVAELPDLFLKVLTGA